ncbi:zinc transporter ZIP3-like [Dreissena polymorpha]|uniref:Uncharacterized protein n=1 Tax=Dreissena polymorpha TaxID=45954 RepID=A0A9D4CWR6_DREPO|nr:zinc transporter ZIP3-like [Dreissena polymorpha]KAH3734893.1 hypothetical protein DPMN_041344 [Dreissena polymorpha]
MVSTAKLSSAGILFAIGIISGLAIPFLSIQCLMKRYKTAASDTVFRNMLAMLNCFTGGVFLATSLLALLPEAHTQMNLALNSPNTSMDTMLKHGREHMKIMSYPMSELLTGCGFLLILFIESIAVMCHQNRHRGHDELLSTASPEIKPIVATDDDCHGFTLYQAAKADKMQNNQGMPNVSTERISDALTIEEATGVSSEGMTNLHNIVLLVALSIHMVFDGLEVGLLQRDEDVWSVLSALSLHNILIFFRMGITLCESTSTRNFITAMIYMSLVSPIGVGLGILVTSDGENVVMETISAVLQSIAVGTFLYVAIFEIIMKEFQTVSYDNRVVKAVAVIIGYLTLCVVMYVMA